MFKIDIKKIIKAIKKVSPLGGDLEGVVLW